MILPNELPKIIYLNWKFLGMVCDKCPAPNQLTDVKIENLLCPPMKEFNLMPKETVALKQDFLKCCPDNVSVPVIVFVSKMFPVRTYLLMSLKENFKIVLLFFDFR